MLQCPNCQNEQEVGKFCGKCGTELIEKEVVAEEEIVEESPALGDEKEVNTEEANQNVVGEKESGTKMEQEQPKQVQYEPIHYEESDQQSTVNVEQMKNSATKYWDLFKITLKNPTKSFYANESHFSFGIANLVLFVITATLAMYFMANTQFRKFADLSSAFGGPSNLPFFEIGLHVFIIYLVIVAAVLFAVFGMEKMFIKNMSFKLFVAQYGGLYTPFLIVHIVALLLGLASSIEMSTYLLMINFIVSLIVMPTLFIFEKLKHYQVGAQRIYISYATMVVIIIVIYIISKVILESYVDDLLYDLDF